MRTMCTTTFTFDEMQLVAEALERLGSHSGNRRDVAAFANAHPEFGLLAVGEDRQ